MSVLRFASEEALRFAVTSSLVAEDILAAPAKTWESDGRICVASEKAFHPEATKRLAAAGVERLPAMTTSPAAREVRCWAELLRVVRTDAVPDPGSIVLFRLAPGTGATSLVDLAGELLRLGCDRLEWRQLDDDGFLLRAAAPPFYTVLRAIDGASDLRAYVPTPRGQDRVWTQIGAEHPLARFLRPEDGHVLLLGVDGFRSVAEGAFEDIYSLVELRVPGAPGDQERKAHAPSPVRRLGITLRLARAAAAGGPSLWVVRDDAVMKIERLLAALPEEVARGILFAACSEEGKTLIVLRLRPGARTDIAIDGEAYRSHASIANLFLPGDTTLEPPLRRDHVRDLLTPDPDSIVWLRPLDGGSFRVESTPDSAFRPLADWVDYIIDTNAASLVPWVASATFAFDAFLGVDMVAATREEAPAPEAPAPRRKTKREPAPAEPAREGADARPVAAPLPTQPLVPLPFDKNAIADELAVIEGEYLALDVPADDPARGALWARMAPLNHRLGRAHDAAMGWARVAWEGDTSVMASWRDSERATSHGVTLPTLLALDAPTRDHVRLVAVLLQTDAEEAHAHLHEASRWLDLHDDVLDVRTAWLARVALSARSGGDRLGLARARDRILAKIHRGLSLERDVPSFLRRAGAGRDAAQVELLAARLEGLVQAFDTTKRKRSATEADPKLTGAYVRFVVAYGFARIGLTDRAGALRDAALVALPKDAIHDVLSRAYVARIAQALEGMAPETPLPADVSASLVSLAKLDRYKVDRVRQASKVLEPHERLDPIMAFQRGETDPRGPEFADLRGIADLAQLDRGLAAIMAKAQTAPPDDRARLYDGVMDFFPALAHDRACGHLETLLGNVADIPALKRAQVLEEALMLAGHFGEERLARKVFGSLEPLVAGIGPDGAVEIAPLASGMLRTLRRFGLRDEAQRLLAALQSAAKGKATPHLVARLHTASALAFLGETERAVPVYEEALSALGGDLPMPERLQLGRALTRALGTAPFPFATAGLDRIVKRLDIVTDSFNTNTHVCLSVVDFVESLVLGYASEDLAVDHAARRFLDEDEYLVRRRIHRDLAR